MNDPYRLVVSIHDQMIRVMNHDECMAEFPVSTATNGTGFENGSFRTPTGNFVICEKIGADCPSGTIFKARLPVGQWIHGEAMSEDLILSRILRLDGLDMANANTLERFIYVHGTNREDLIGRPASDGCIRLRNEDMIRLFDIVEVGDRMQIA